MRTVFHRCVSVSSLLLLGYSIAYAADTYSFSVIPASGEIGGPPGALIGWGYQITNNSTTDWLQTEAMNAGLFQNGTLDIGDYFDLPVIAPGSTDTVNFVAASGSGSGDGLAGLTWNVNAPLGFTLSGDFDLSACFAPSSTAGCTVTAPDVLAPYSATVSPLVPEPSARMLFFIGLCMLCGVAVRSRTPAAHLIHTVLDKHLIN